MYSNVFRSIIIFITLDFKKFVPLIRASAGFPPTVKVRKFEYDGENWGILIKVKEFYECALCFA